MQLGHNDRLGNTVVDGEGFTLYRFDPDSANPSKATCVGDCAVTWPPVLANDKIVFQRLYRDKISTVTRPDGTQQVTIGGWPVYRFSKDTAAGEIKGEGVGGPGSRSLPTAPRPRTAGTEVFGRRGPVVCRPHARGS